MTVATDTTVRVLTVRQPWADLITAGAKDVENRSWPVPSTLPQWTCCVWCATRPELPRQTGMRHLHDSPVGERWWSDAEPYGPFPFRLWIHAGKSIDHHTPNWAWAALPTDRHRRLSERYGVLLGSVSVTGCHHAEDCKRRTGGTVRARPNALAHEYEHCSRWAEPDAWHWTLADPQPLDSPIPMKGRRGLWTATLAKIPD